MSYSQLHKPLTAAPMTIARQLVSTKSIEALVADANNSSLVRTLGAMDLILMGIGAVVGSGIFVLPGQAAALFAGPAVMLAFVIAGVVAALAGLCYAELASIVPVSGSSYTYAYATVGELAAWIVAWNVVLGAIVSVAAVGQGWTSYFLAMIGRYAGSDPHDWNRLITQTPIDDSMTATGSIMNLPAMLILLCVGVLVIFGTKKSTMINTVVVTLKLGVIILVTICLFTKLDTNHLKPFLPPRGVNPLGVESYGVQGLFKASSFVFFAYLGFDMISTTAQECKRPARDLPIGIIGSLTICTILYILVCFGMTGTVDYTELNVLHPISLIVEKVGFHWLSYIVDIGAVVGLLSVLITMQMGPPRVLMIMAQDGLMPQFLTKLHPKYQTPWVGTVICSSASAFCAAFLPIEMLVNMSSYGTLCAFAITCSGVIVLRHKRPDIERPFKVPGGPYFLPLAGIISCLGLIASGGMTAFLHFLVWLFVGICVYFAYGRRHSKINPKNWDIDGVKGLDMVIAEKF